MAVDIYLRSTGTELKPAGPLDAGKLAELPKGVSLRCAVSRPRSTPAHRMLFGVIAVAFETWPEGHKFKPVSLEHLRSWCLIKAGHYNSLDIPAHNPQLAAAIVIKLVEQVKAADKTPIIWPMDDSVRVFTPKSIAYSELSQSDFNQISEAVYMELEKALGVKLADLKRQAEKDDPENNHIVQRILKEFPGAEIEE